MKILLDTCFLLDFLMDREISCFQTSKSICDLFDVYRKETKDASIVCKRINDLLSIISHLDKAKEDVQKL